MSRPSLAARIERLEQGATSTPWRVELAALEAEHARHFPGELPDAFATWPAERLDAYLAFQASDQARRLIELRQMAKSPEQRAQDRAVCLAIASMTGDQVAAYLAELQDLPPCT